MKKKFFLALAVVLCTIALVAGGTFALFTDQTTASNNQFTAGKLQIVSFRDNDDSIPGPMFYTTDEEGTTYDGQYQGNNPTGVWAPGDTWERILVVQNDAGHGTLGHVCTSTMNAYLDRVKAVYQEGDSALANMLNVEILAPDPEAPSNNVVVATGTLDQFLNSTDGIPLRFSDNTKVFAPVRNQKPLTFKVHFSKEAGNQYRDNTLKVNFIVIAEQAKNNP